MNLCKVSGGLAFKIFSISLFLHCLFFTHFLVSQEKLPVFMLGNWKNECANSLQIIDSNNTVALNFPSSEHIQIFNYGIILHEESFRNRAFWKNVINFINPLTQELYLQVEIAYGKVIPYSIFISYGLAEYDMWVSKRYDKCDKNYTIYLDGTIVEDISKKRSLFNKLYEKQIPVRVLSD